VLVEEGDRVAAGALLALIEDPALPAGSLEAKAGVAAAQAAKAAADQELARQDRLVTAGIGARRDLDEARAKAASAAAELDAAKARAGLASSQLARREIRSPRAGVVLHVHRKVGETVDGTGAMPIAEVADVSVLEVHAQAAPAQLARLAENMHATAHLLGSDQPIDAIVVRVAPAVDPSTLLGLVRLALAKSDGVKVGTAASAEIVIAQRPGLRVPASALRRSPVGDDQVIVCAGGVARVRKVDVGARSAKGVELRSNNVKAGEAIVVDHVLGLEDGQPLRAQGSK
jgi:RND family efflux transporter MFP subunit